MTLRLAAAAFVIASVAAALRIPYLDARPMHADEAMLADKFGTLLEHGDFKYDPADFHGPVLEYLSFLPAELRGQKTYAALDEWTLRLAPAVAGIALALSPLLFTAAIGEIAAMIAGLLIATSVPDVFYSRDYIPETLLSLFTALFVATLWHASERANMRIWLIAGLIAGCALATKETAIIAIVAALAAFIAGKRPGWRALAVFSAGVIAVPILLIGPVALWAAAGNYWQRAAGAGMHHHSSYYYVSLLLGVPGRYSDAAVLSFAVGAAAVLRARRWIAYAFLVLAIYSVIPYKTPWCILSFAWAMSMAAGIAAAEAIRRAPRIIISLLAVILLYRAWQCRDSSVTHTADPANQWVYAQTGPGVFVIRDGIRRTADASSDGKNLRVGIYTRENLWPLPWYLRGYPNVRWSRQVAFTGSAPPVILASPDMERALTRSLYENQPPGERELFVPLFPEYVELRPGVEVRGYIRKSLYDRMDQALEK